MPKESFPGKVRENQPTTPERAGVEKTLSTDIDLEAEEPYKDLAPKEVYGLITTNTKRLDAMRSLRPLFQGEAGELWDETEQKADKILQYGAPLEESRKVLEQLDNLTIIVEELNSLLIKKRGS